MRFREEFRENVLEGLSRHQRVQLPELDHIDGFDINAAEITRRLRAPVIDLTASSLETKASASGMRAPLFHDIAQELLRRHN